MRLTTLFLGILLLAAPLPARGEGIADRLIEFELEDQFQETHRDEDFAGKVVVLVGSDRGGSGFNAPWGQALHEALQGHPHRDQVVFLPVADTRGAPFFLKGYIRGKFPEDPERWTLLDWKGRLAQAYAFHPDHCNIVVFDHEGYRVERLHGREVDPDRVAALATTVAGLLDQAR